MRIRKEKEGLEKCWTQSVNLPMKNFILVLVVSHFCTHNLYAQFRSGRNQTASEATLNYASPQEYTIAAIEVTGLNVLDKSAMVSLTGLKIGDKIKIPGAAISGAIRKL